MPSIKSRIANVMCMLSTVMLIGCTQRGELQYIDTDQATDTLRIWVANSRSDVQADGQSAPPRPETVQYEAIDVSIPPTHVTGQIEWPSGQPNLDTDFVSVGKTDFPDRAAFTSAIARADTDTRQETIVFVHGYNTRHAEAVYQMAQFAHDFEVPSPPVIFSWPSAGITAGYVYDRDSALISRNNLEDLLVSLVAGNRRVVLVGHSMGSYLIMETLRQVAHKRTFDIAQKIDALILMAPDIDGELFRLQAQEIDPLPDPFILMVAEQDRALRISSLLTGRRPRLGAQTDRTVVGDLPISVVDVSDLSDGAAFEHKISTTSPAAISIIRKLSEETPPGELSIGELVVLSDLAPTGTSITEIAIVSNR